MEDILGPLFPLTYFFLLAIERFLSGRPMPPVRGWVFRGVAMFVVGLAFNIVLPELLAGVLAPLRLFDLTGLGLAAGVVITLLGATFADYWLHRLMHTVPAVWRWTHQMHHSAERVDMAGFAYTHPFELVLAVTTASFAGTLLGASPDAVMLAGYLSFLISLLQHTNVRTPVWLGWFVQRPEGHLVHHTRGIHAYNYGLPLWDALFGTRRNPADWQAEYGFWDGASARVGAMLLGRDVGEPPAERALERASA